MKYSLTLVFFLLLVSLCFSQSVWTNPITDANPSLSNPFTLGQTVDPNITVSGIGRGIGITGNAGSNRYNANSWNTPSFDADAYFYFTLTPNSGSSLNLISFVYTGQASGTGPTSFQFSSSIDGFSSSIGSPNGAGTTIDLSGTSFQNITSEITFRIYGWGASSAAGTFSINDFTFNGTTTSLPVEFSHIKVTKKNKSNTIFFSTASEINNDFFTIERSFNGFDFEPVGTLKGGGNTTSTQNYFFEDQNVPSGVLYYRIKQTDFDGRFDYSDVVKVNGNTNKIDVFSGRTGGQIVVRTEIDNYDLEIFSISGIRLFYQQNLSLDAEIFLQNVPSGMCIVRVVAPDGIISKQIML
ncbi:MAG: T9SS type A sorting domain-containing protein [Saprospiraceae bacterium]|nr:T9SS type A sorting domain-containing protein [Saprospiraceae bacterium]